jgi:hypothetical protein
MNKPPRPPNAWILYRSDKLKELQADVATSHLPQAVISKMISSMRKAESPEVLAYYEQLSDMKKKEHDEKYPEYHFQPMKKAEKDCIHAEKWAMKGQARATANKRQKCIVAHSHYL